MIGNDVASTGRKNGFWFRVDMSIVREIEFQKDLVLEDFESFIGRYVTILEALYHVFPLDVDFMAYPGALNILFAARSVTQFDCIVAEKAEEITEKLCQLVGIRFLDDKIKVAFCDHDLLMSACKSCLADDGLLMSLARISGYSEQMMSCALVGLPSVNGLETKQRKHLTIVVDLIGNPSIVFVDEPNFSKLQL
ncbi:hypothetical protein Tco_0441954 [Tanacetum coccineum]